MERPGDTLGAVGARSVAPRIVLMRDYPALVKEKTPVDVKSGWRIQSGFVNKKESATARSVEHKYSRNGGKTNTG